MSGNADKYQVVFLIDLHTCVPKDEGDTSVDRIGPCICLSALRILTLLSSQVDASQNDKQTIIRWGFKFYNSVTRRFQKYHLREFTREEFDKFESEVEIAIESERAKNHGLVRKNIGACVSSERNNTDCHRKTTDEDDIDHVDKLQCALREIVSDFQWDQPDINSPVKNFGIKRLRSSGRKSLLSDFNASHQYNLTFLLSKCPHSTVDLTRFVGIDHEVKPQDALSSFMPATIYRQFFECARIRLFWIDLNLQEQPPLAPDSKSTCNYEEDISGLSTMHAALASVGGGVLPLNTIVQLGSFSTVSIQLLAGKEKLITSGAVCDDPNLDNAKSGLVLPHSLLLKWSLKNLPSDPQQIPTQFKAKLLRKQADGHSTTVGEVDILAMTNSKTKQINYPNSINLTDASSNKYSWSLECVRNLNGYEGPSKSHVQVLNSEHGPIQHQSYAKDQDYNLNICGTLRHGDIPIQSLDTASVYIVKMATSSSTIPFSQIISQLAAHNLVMAVTSECQNSISSRLGILQPITCDLASLTFVRTEMLHSLEKEIFLPETSSEDHTSLSQFVSEHVERLCLQTKGMEFTSVPKGLNSAGIPHTIAFQSACTEPWFRSSVTSDTIDGFINSLCERDSEERIEAAEVTALQAIQKSYHEQMYCCPALKQRGTPKKRISSSKASPRKKGRKTPSKALRRSPRKTPRKTPKKAERKIGKYLAKQRSGSALTKSRSFSAPFGRTAVIIQKSQLVAAQNLDEDEPQVDTNIRVTRATKKENSLSQLSDKDFQDESELVEHLQKYHENFMNGDTQGVTCAQTMVNVALHYIKSTKPECPEKSAEDLFKSNIMLSTKQIKEKYTGNDENVDACVSEYQIQILLHLELESLLMNLGRTEEDQVQTVQEVTSMLTRITLLKDSAFVGAFMREILVENYVETVPKLLGNIYEELMLPLPPQLESLFSGSDDDTSVLTSSVQPLSVLSDLGSVSRSSWSPGTQRSMRNRRSVVSIANINMGKNRQIALPAKPARKDERKNQKKQKKTLRSVSAKKKKVAECPKSEAKLVRRNLFMGEQPKGKNKLERHQSVPAMDVGNRQPKTPKKKLDPQVPKTPKSHHILKTKKVQETPVHKQVQKVMWRKLEKERRRVHTVSEVDIIEESPNKVPSKDTKLSLARRASVGNMRRTSFYSAGTDRESRNVQRYQQLEARMTCHNPLTSPSSKISTKVSPPRRINPVNLFANLSSPSPQKPHGRLIPNTSSAVRSLRDFDMDSPSKNTRARSLFAPPEVDHPSAVDKASNPQPIGMHGISPHRGNKGSTPRRAVLRRINLSPKSHSMPSNCFTSPVKSVHSMTSFKTPEKSVSRLHATEDGVFGSPTTPRRSKRLASPTSSGFTNIYDTPDKQRLSSQACTPKRELRTPVKSVSFQNTPRKSNLPTNALSPLSIVRTPKKDGQNVLENWARKALRNTPQRTQRMAISSPLKYSFNDTTVENLRNDVVKPFDNTATLINNTTFSGCGVDVITEEKPRTIHFPGNTTGASCTTVPFKSVPVTQTKSTTEIPMREGANVQISERSAAENTSMENSGDKDKNVLHSSDKCVSKLDRVNPICRKRTLSDANDDEMEQGTPSKRRRTLRARSMFSSGTATDTSLDYFESSEVFIENSSVQGSTKENSPTGPAVMQSPRKLTEAKHTSRMAPCGRILRGRSAGSDSLGSQDSEFPSTSFKSCTSKNLRSASNTSDSLGADLHQDSPILCDINEQSANKFTTPSQRNKASPSTIGRKYSPSISTMSLAHLMQSPLLEDSNSVSKSSRSSRSRVTQGTTSRRSLYKTDSPTD